MLSFNYMFWNDKKDANDLNKIKLCISTLMDECLHIKYVERSTGLWTKDWLIAEDLIGFLIQSVNYQINKQNSICKQQLIGLDFIEERYTKLFDGARVTKLDQISRVWNLQSIIWIIMDF